MEEIKESKVFRIKNKIIRLDGIHKIANLIYEESKNIGSGYMRFSAKCTDGSSFESKNPDIFSPDSKLNFKRVGGLQAWFDCSEKNLNIHINIYQSYHYENSDISVTGTDSTWVNGVLRNLEEIVDGFPDQNQFINNNYHLISNVFAIGIGVLYMWVIDFIPSIPVSKKPEWAIILGQSFENSPIYYYLFRYFLGYIVGLIPGYFLSGKLKELWPSIEIQIGPEHKLIEKKRRNWIAFTLTTCVIPLVISLIFYAMKLFIFSGG